MCIEMWWWIYFVFSQGSEIKTVKVDYLYVYVHCIKACAAIANCLLIPTVKILV